MASEKLLSTPIAIVLAGGLVALGLFFGLRGREAPPPAPIAAATIAVATQPPPLISAPTVVPVTAVPPPPPTGSVDRDRVQQAAMKDLERHRAAVVAKCIEPALKKKPAPPTIKLSFNVTFDAQGKQIARGVTEDRETMREGVSMCAMDTIPDLSVPPPGGPVQVELIVTFP